MASIYGLVALACAGIGVFVGSLAIIYLWLDGRPSRELRRKELARQRLYQKLHETNPRGLVASLKTVKHRAIPRRDVMRDVKQIELRASIRQRAEKRQFRRYNSVYNDDSVA